MIASIFSRAMRGKVKPTDSLAHISAAELGEAVAAYRVDDDKPGFLLHVRGAMLGAGFSHEQARARLESFLALVRQKSH